MKGLSVRQQLISTLFIGMAGLLVFVSLTQFGAKRQALTEMNQIRAASDVRLIQLYLDLELPGSWSLSSDGLYKGGVRVTANWRLNSELRKLLAPDVSFSFLVGSPPEEIRRGFSGMIPPTFLMRFLSRGAPKVGPSLPVDFIPHLTRDGIAADLMGSDGKPVGWLSITTGGGIGANFQKDVLTSFFIELCLFTALLLFVLYIVIFRLSSPIERLIESNMAIAARNEHLQRLSRIDPLTGLLNRRGLIEIMESPEYRATNENTESIVAMLDIDDFKRVNDTYGHLCGDYVLRELGVLIKKCVRKHDLGCRWGGEEFLVVYPDIASAVTSETVERLRTAICEHDFTYEGRKIAVTVTIGITLFGSPERFTEAVDEADDALYQGKHAGKNRVVFYSQGSCNG
jgi:diguanylate cyclase (GGDEF)-like protein